MDINLVGLKWTSACCLLVVPSSPNIPRYAVLGFCHLNEECCVVYLTCYRDFKTMHIFCWHWLTLDTSSFSQDRTQFFLPWWRGWSCSSTSSLPQGVFFNIWMFQSGSLTVPCHGVCLNDWMFEQINASVFFLMFQSDSLTIQCQDVWICKREIVPDTLLHPVLNATSPSLVS